MIRQERMQIVRHKQLAENIFELTCIGQLVSEMKEPGQFVHVRVSDSYEPLLRRPISIASIDRETLEFTMIYRADGRGTTLLSRKQVGEELDVLGPLGHGFPLHHDEKGSTVLLVGGGIGVPPLYELSKRLNENGIQTIHVLGFLTESVVFYEEKFRALGETIVCTIDGSRGTKGFVTDAIEVLPANFQTYYACGPTPMLRALQHQMPTIPGFLSFEERMGCGIGACFACVCKTESLPDKEYVKICSDGPVFPAGVISL
ncbi:dihydroorotate dehydrogenase electron transfer subunit [Paenisporosarcina cavernae]|uniref:Dihydroorotate dehydrogenase B (NAD(+)), electron transfer subunit n=1 Tax=Paenisporosarcina cavernae TaxID=2320858 RepID=A0A385YRR1_9BACL|nr:dihydroorotate dehydrogenase electron transfer subunit [Paenisporosarcina cavernae]AYC29184.1 dihydroorotate dehydrogenase electron transfer subunit [Paenisporosarcina cavernae]